MKANILNRSALATALTALLAAPMAQGMDYNTAHGLRGASGQNGAGVAKAAACTPAVSITELALNNVRGLLTTSGLLWYDKAEGNAAYEVPKTENRDGPKAIFAGGLWMGGLSPDNQLKIAAVRYRDGNDFWPGPLTVGGDAAVTSDVCARYDNFYQTKKEDAELHQAYYACLADPDCDPSVEFPDGYAIPAAYFDWPAINTTPGYDTYLAPFTDFNNDGDYDPTAGDYPGYDLEQEVDCENRFRDDPIPLFGDLNIWWVVNDKGAQHTETGGQPIGMEIRSQAFAFSTNDEVNNMTFYNYVLINRGTQTLTNTYFGQYADPDLGGSDDDFTGCDVQRGLGYVYNADENDETQNGAPGYGTQPPAIGIDFFEGPYQDEDGADNPGPESSAPYPDCDEAVTLKGIGYKGIGIGYGDDTPDNERFGMRAFIYYNREGTQAMTDPSLAVHYYNYLRSIWKDGTPMTYGGTGYQPNNPNALRCYYMFPGDSDPIGWGTDCVPQDDWQESSLQNPDRRFIQSAGPFTLEPGDYNNITVGVVYARATNGGAFASVIDLRKADDKAQALFDNCFRILDGPDAPNVEIQELDRELVLYLTNPNSSNNFNETYGDEDRNSQDPTIPEFTVIPAVTEWQSDPDNPDLVAPLDTGILVTIVAQDTVFHDRNYRFQGYQVYQVRDGDVSVSDLGNVDLARLIGVYDIQDTVDQIVNWINNTEIGLPVATLMVNGPDTGVVHSLSVTEDLFAAGDKRLVNYKTYYYITIAYSHNNYEDYNPDPDLLSGQARPYLAGRKAASGSIRSYSGIPHPPASEAGGTIQNAQYGDEFAITRIEGQGNGGLALSISGVSEEELTNPPYRTDQLKYIAGKGPVKVKVVDPLKVPDAEFELFLLDSTDLPSANTPTTYTRLNDAFWKLVRLNPDGSTEFVYSDRAIEVGNEQLLLDWGISVTVDQSVYQSGFTHPLEGEFSYTVGSDGSITPWYQGIFDTDGETELNWIRSGTAADTALEYEDWSLSGTPKDPDQDYEKLFGTWSPFGLVGTGDFQPASSETAIQSLVETGTPIRNSTSVLVVFTPDKTKWTRCAVLETCPKPILTTPANTKKMRMKTRASVDKNGIAATDQNPPVPYNPQDGELNGATGMGWFPGYAIDLESGERLNMAFGEDSFWGGDIGKDMIWNPSDDISIGEDYAILGGGHWIYVFNNLRRMSNDAAQMPHYDNGEYLQATLLGDNSAGRTRVWRSCNWVGSSALIQGTELLSPLDGLIPNELRIRLCINKPYFTYTHYNGEVPPGVNTDRNGGLGLYSFSTKGLETQTAVSSVEEDNLDEIAVVPNPYYAFSGYETSRLDNRVKFINLPRKCTISIYNVSGTLVRQFRKDNDLTYVDWDLKNQTNVPIAGGTYICHVEVPGAGETVLKWFGVMRPVDLQNF